MRWMIVGHGSREHAIARRIRSECDMELLSYACIPSVGLSTVADAQVVGPYSTEAILSAARDAAVAVVIVALEDLIFTGVADALHTHGIRCFAPKRAFAWLEQDKPRAKRLVQSLSRSVQVTPFAVCRDLGEFAAFIRHWGHRVVLKSTDLSSSKCLYVLRHNADGGAGLVQSEIAQHGSVLVERFVEGIDFTVMCVTDGRRAIFLDAIRDYPFRHEGEHGPKTGGMGCVSGVAALSYIDDRDLETTTACVLRVLESVRQQQQCGFRGVLMTQFIKSVTGEIYFNEFDVRPGDPETIHLMYGLAGQFVDVVNGVVHGSLGGLKCYDPCVVSVCHVQPDYPQGTSPLTLRLPRSALDIPWLHIGNLVQATTEPSDWYRAGMGRALTVTAEGATLEAASTLALQRSRDLALPLSFRTDIGSPLYTTLPSSED